ncbi:MAG: FAD-dependent oxidoreductase [Beijerinckiaceae bacterium]|nr:FAD-dependent oxidoreductase [Beijerinckiaceae bacterium]MCZ8301653.1 FAD-dependent oxidoreductase [Beijerinckiaceae bacterium]
MARHLVLLGGGHSHIGVLRAFVRRRPADTLITLVSERPASPYSGMLPGHLAGFYPREALEIPLAPLAAAAGARFVEARATGIDRARRRLLLADHEALPYDWLAVNIGITPDLAPIEGAREFGFPVKPISRFLDSMDTVCAALARPDGARSLAVIGGGPAAVELALAFRQVAKRVASGPVAITLLVRSGLVPRLNRRAQALVRAALTRHDIRLVEAFDAIRIDPQGATARDGRHEATEAVIVATGARAAGWLATTGLPAAADGSLLVGPDLRSLGDDRLFASGDCATMADSPHEKAGVFAVRQGLVLAENLLRLASGMPLEGYRPQSASLALLSTGDGRAIAARGDWLALEGRWVMRWKDWLDRRFVTG